MKARRPGPPMTFLARLGTTVAVGLTLSLSLGSPTAARTADAWRAALQSTSTSAPQRIISVVPAVTEMLFAVGAGDQVVAVSSFDHYPIA